MERTAASLRLHPQAAADLLAATDRAGRVGAVGSRLPPARSEEWLLVRSARCRIAEPKFPRNNRSVGAERPVPPQRRRPPSRRFGDGQRIAEFFRRCPRRRDRAGVHADSRGRRTLDEFLSSWLARRNPPIRIRARSTAARKGDGGRVRHAWYRRWQHHRRWDSATTPGAESGR